MQHARIRRLLAPGFTTSAVKDLAPMIESYADLLVRKLGEFADGVQVLDMSHWFEWAVSFDLAVHQRGREVLCMLADELI